MAIQWDPTRPQRLGIDGGSHTQQNVLEQLFVDAALKAGSTADSRPAVERVAGRRAIPLERYVGWRSRQAGGGGDVVMAPGAGQSICSTTRA